MKVPTTYSIGIAAAILVSGLVALPLINNPAKGQVSPTLFGSDICAHKVLFDNVVGHVRGWDPNGIQTVFKISDTCVSPLFSVVLVNTKQFNFVICAVDYLWSGAFEVKCNIAPSNGGELHYDVFNKFVTPATAESAALSPDVVNSTEARIAQNATESLPLSSEQVEGAAPSNETRTPP